MASESPARRLFPALLCLALAAALTIANYWLVSQPGLGLYEDMRDRVLRNHARNFYQYDLYFLAHADAALRATLHLRPIVALTSLFACSYLAALLASWYWLAQQHRRVGGVVGGLLATAVYLAAMLPFSYHHLADMAALACFALCLGLTVRRRTGWVLAVSALAGLFSSKHLLVAVPVLLQCLQGGRWPRAALLAGGVAAASLLVPATYRLWLLGPHPVVATGTLEAGKWQQALPYALLVHLMLAAAPLASLYAFRRRVTPVLAGAVAAYLLLLIICTLQLNIIHEARTFWVGVPAFAAALAFWTLPEQALPDAAEGSDGSVPASS